MTDRGAAERACKDPNPIIDGRKANVNLAYLGAKPRSLQTGKMRFISRLVARKCKKTKVISIHKTESGCEVQTPIRTTDCLTGMRSPSSKDYLILV